MKLHRSDIEARCIERGYSWDLIIPCLTRDLGDGWYDVDTSHEAYPRAGERVVHQAFELPADMIPQPKPGLGDMVAAGLSAIGITKERVSAVVGGDCGCAKRQEALNALGRKIGIG